MAVGNIGYILCPCFPISARTTFLYDFRINTVLPFLQVIKIQTELCVRLLMLFALSLRIIITRVGHTNHLNIVRLFAIQIDLVDGIIKPIIMRS